MARLAAFGELCFLFDILIWFFKKRLGLCLMLVLSKCGGVLFIYWGIEIFRGWKLCMMFLIENTILLGLNSSRDSLLPLNVHPLMFPLLPSLPLKILPCDLTAPTNEIFVDH